MEELSICQDLILEIMSTDTPVVVPVRKSIEKGLLDEVEGKVTLVYYNIKIGII